MAVYSPSVILTEIVLFPPINIVSLILQELSAFKTYLLVVVEDPLNQETVALKELP